MSINLTQGVTKQPVTIDGESAIAKRSEAELTRQPSAYREASASYELKEAAQQKAQVKQVTQQINEFMESHSIQLNFSVDPELSQIVVKVREKHTGKLIRQIPSEEALRLSKTMEALQGMLIKHKV